MVIDERSFEQTSALLRGWGSYRRARNLQVLIVYLFFLPVMLPSVLPELGTDSAVTQTEFPSGCGAASPSQGPWDPDPLRPALSLGGQATAWEGEVTAKGRRGRVNEYNRLRASLAAQ